MAETRTQKEGSLWWVRASGSGRTWATASAPASGLFGFVQSFTYTSAQTTMQVSERGVPNHKKLISEGPINGNATFYWTGILPSAVSGSGASLPMYHMEYKAIQPENGNTGLYTQFMGVSFDNIQFTEGGPSQIQVNFDALNMIGPTGSGYIS